MTTTDKEAAAQWARELLMREDWVILDTETTGLSGAAEIVQIAVIAPAGQPLLDTLVRPIGPIPSVATVIHGITDAMVADAPTWDQVLPALHLQTTGKTVVIYNAGYDLSVIRYCCEMAGQSCGLIGPLASCVCAMRWYSQWVGDWSSYHRTYRYQRLPGGDHSALGDALATLAVIRRMAE